MTSEPQVNIQGWAGPSRPDFRDYTVAQRLPWVLRLAAPVSVPSLTLGKFPVEDQGALGSCVGQTLEAACRYEDTKAGDHIEGSVLFMYLNARKESGLPVNQDTGAYIRGGSDAARKYGRPPESMWLYDVSKFAQEPPQPVYTKALERQALESISVPNDIETMKQLIAAQYCICIGFSVYSNYGSAISTGIWPEASGSQVGGHAVLVDGYEPGWWYFRNSWGNTGLPTQRGWYKMSMNFLQQNGADFWAIKRVEETEPVPPPPPPPEPTDEEAEKRELQRLLTKHYGVVASADVNFTKGPSWHLPIKPPGV